MLLWGVLAAVLIALDQTAKHFVVLNISATDTIKIIDGVLEFVYVKNTGGAFSILNNSTWLLALVSVVFCVGVAVYFIKEKPENRMFCLAMCLMFGGAVGNAIDRVVRGFVVDFIKTAFIDFPVFNIADIAITSGAVLLIIYIMFFDNTKNVKKRN